MIMKGMIYEPFGVPKLAFGDMIISLGVTIAAGIPSFRKFNSFPMMFSPILLIVINHNKLIYFITILFPAHFILENNSNMYANIQRK